LKFCECDEKMYVLFEKGAFNHAAVFSYDWL